MERKWKEVESIAVYLGRKGVCPRVCYRAVEKGRINRSICSIFGRKKIQTNKKLFNLKTDDQEIGLEMLGEGRDRAVRRGRDATEEKI